MTILAALFAAALIAVLIRSPRTLSLSEEERLLREYFRKIDRNERDATSSHPPPS